MEILEHSVIDITSGWEGTRKLYTEFMPHFILFIIAPCGQICGEGGEEGGGCRIIILEWFIILPRSRVYSLL